MARPYRIQSTFDDLGMLLAGEHHEGDDEGVRQVEGLLKALRQFKTHEDQEAAQRDQAMRTAMQRPLSAQVREATYELADGRHVYYQGPDTLKDASDLYTVLAEQHSTGSPNVENVQARSLVSHLQTGNALSEAQIGLLRKLVAKHQPAIDALRARPDHDGQNLLADADAGPSARISAGR